jgi:hypothetical protein
MGTFWIVPLHSVSDMNMERKRNYVMKRMEMARNRARLWVHFIHFYSYAGYLSEAASYSDDME